MEDIVLGAAYRSGLHYAELRYICLGTDASDSGANPLSEVKTSRPTVVSTMLNATCTAQTYK